jgi:hypothetical protein
MKNYVLSLLILLATLGTTQAQRVGLNFNFSSFDIDKASSGNTVIDYQGSTSLSANLRLFTQGKWAIRFGAGVDNLKYTVSDEINTNYSAVRQDMKGILGLEKHFVLADRLDIYPGVYVPIIVTGDEIIQDNYDNVTGGGVRAGLGVLLGANVKLFKIFRVGVEFDAGYDHFKEGVWQAAQNRSFVPIRGINHSTAFTVGLAF